MVQRLKTAALVLVVSLLIWLYAEAELLRSETFPSVSVAFSAPPAGARTVWLLDRVGTSVFASVTIEGSTAALAAVRESLTRELVLTPGRELPSTPGEHAVQLKDALRLHEAFIGLPLTIVETTPAEVRVRVDELLSLPMPVEVVVPESVALVGAAVPVPTEARLHVPASLRDLVPPGARLLARIEPSRLSTAPPGEPIRLADLRLAPPEGLRSSPGIRIDPPSVGVTLAVRGATDEYVKASVPVHVRIPDFLLDEWRVSIPEEDRNLRNVRVSGPAELVDLIRTDRVPLIAFVPLTFEDLEKRITSKEAIFAPDLPIGGPRGQLRIEAEDRTITLEIRPREQVVGPLAPPTDPD